MKAKELQELRKKDAGELHEKLGELRTEVMNLRFSHATGALENSSRMARTKRDVARVLTTINQQRAERNSA